MLPSDTTTIFLFVATLVVFCVLYAIGNNYSRKKHPTYHYEEDGFTIVCVFKQYKRSSEYREFKFKKNEDGEYKFVLFPWLKNFILKLIAVEAIALSVMVFFQYRLGGSMEGIDIWDCVAIAGVFIFLLCSSEWFILLKAKRYIRNINENS